MTTPSESDFDAAFLTVFNNSLVGMLVTGEDHLIKIINDHLLKLAELDRKDVIGKTGLQLGLLNETFVKSIWHEFTQTEKLQNRELTFKTKSNNTVECLFSTEKIILNNTAYRLTTIIDITERKKTQNELADIYERVSDGFVAIDRNWNYKYINKQASEVLGKHPNDLVGKHVWTEYPREADNPVVVAYHQAMNMQEMVVAEAYSENFKRWFQHLIYPSADGISIIFRDISKHKEAEKRLQESELRFKTLTSTAPVGIFETKANGSTTYVNETWLQYTGMHFEEAMGDGWLDAVHPDDRDWLQKGWHSKTQIQSESFSEYRLIDKQGKQRWVNGRAVPVFSDTGAVSGYIGIILDVTERKTSEERIVNSEESKRLILNSALDAIVIVDSISKITFWNPQAEKIFGWAADEVIGKTLMETIIPAEYEKAHRQGMQHYLQAGEGPILNRLIEVSACNKAGLMFPIELSILPVEQETGRSFCAFIRNITERKQAESSLKESSEQLRELSRHLQKVREEERTKIAREIHDELGQQLTGLKMDIAWLMKKSGMDNPDIKNKFADTLSLVDKTVRSIRRIATELRPSIIDDLGLNASLEWQVAEFGKRMDSEIKYKNSFDDTNINPDISIGLFRILQESLTNIAKHSAAKKIKINIGQINDAVQLTVEDDGVGFDTTAKKDQLTFGLMGIKERTSMLHGECTVFSKPATGTKIEVIIPLKKA